MGDKHKNFTDLIVWQKGHLLALDIYTLTKRLPRFEEFGLVSQMNRASVSVTSNIAEGFGRYWPKEKANFYIIARASLQELESQLLLTRDIKYISIDRHKEIDNKCIEIHKLLTNLIHSIKN